MWEDDTIEHIFVCRTVCNVQDNIGLVEDLKESTTDENHRRALESCNANERKTNCCI